jgi:membrane-bound inhibitor of C-type lysozyme
VETTPLNSEPVSSAGGPRPLAALAAALLAGLLWSQAGTAQSQSSNTATTRAFTTEWTCDNGRTVLVNAHPRRPREVAHVTYLGNRVAVKPKGPASEGRHVSEDGKVVWQWKGNEGLLSFEGLLAEPVTCTRGNTNTTPKK